MHSRIRRNLANICFAVGATLIIVVNAILGNWFLSAAGVLFLVGTALYASED